MFDEARANEAPTDAPQHHSLLILRQSSHHRVNYQSDPLLHVSPHAGRRTGGLPTLQACSAFSTGVRITEELSFKRGQNPLTETEQDRNGENDQ